MTSGTQVGTRPMRADARRNYQRLLTAAGEVFAEGGSDASLEDIARRAEVGIGTLYRHFPTRQALLEEVLAERYRKLADFAERIGDSRTPLDALMGWIRALVEHSRTYRGLHESVIATIRDPTSDLSTICQRMVESGRHLLERAQQAGQVRTDIDFKDVTSLAMGVAWASEKPADPHPNGHPTGAARVDRLLAVVADGLRPRD